jgi:hypothetical protein
MNLTNGTSWQRRQWACSRPGTTAVPSSSRSSGRRSWRHLKCSAAQRLVLYTKPDCPLCDGLKVTRHYRGVAPTSVALQCQPATAVACFRLLWKCMHSQSQRAPTPLPESAGQGHSTDRPCRVHAVGALGRRPGGAGGRRGQGTGGPSVAQAGQHCFAPQHDDEKE